MRFLLAPLLSLLFWFEVSTELVRLGRPLFDGAVPGVLAGVRRGTRLCSLSGVTMLWSSWLNFMPIWLMRHKWGKSLNLP